jgi:hypothetical protein
VKNFEIKNTGNNKCLVIPGNPALAENGKMAHQYHNDKIFSLRLNWKLSLLFKENSTSGDAQIQDRIFYKNHDVHLIKNI